MSATKRVPDVNGPLLHALQDLPLFVSVLHPAPLTFQTTQPNPYLSLYKEARQLRGSFEIIDKQGLFVATLTINMHLL